MQGYHTDATVLFTEESPRLLILATRPLDIHEAIIASSTNVITTLGVMHSDAIISNPYELSNESFPRAS
jgi:hypothetical protein